MRPDPNRGIFFYPRRGYGQISEALAEAATAAGAEILTGTEVVGDRRDRRDHRRTACGTTRRWCGRRSRSRWSRGSRRRPDDVLAAATRLETRALLLVYLALPARRWTEFDAHYFPEADVPLSRISECKNYRDSADDPRDVTVLCAEVPCALGDTPLERLPREALAGEVRDALARSALATPTPIDIAVRRVPRAYPIYRLGYERPFATLDAWASAQPNFLHFGRQGLFAHDNTHHALAMAWAAADALAEGGTVDERRLAPSPRRVRVRTSSKTELLRVELGERRDRARVRFSRFRGTKNWLPYTATVVRKV